MASGAFQRVGASALTAKLHLDSLAKVAVGVGAAFGALEVVKGVFTTGIGEVKDYQAGYSQLQSGLKSTGGVAGMTSDQMEKLAGTSRTTPGRRTTRSLRLNPCC
jgi:hypothetical protein